jgi:hypothetical protein
MDFTTFLPILAVTLVLIGAAVIALAIGPLFGRRCIRGSCGGAAGAHDDDRIACEGCPNRPARERAVDRAGGRDAETHSMSLQHDLRTETGRR